MNTVVRARKHQVLYMWDQLMDSIPVGNFDVLGEFPVLHFAFLSILIYICKCMSYHFCSRALSRDSFIQRFGSQRPSNPHGGGIL